MVLAGYIQTTANWMWFSDAWSEELRSAPAISYFKMKEAFGLNGEFGGWNRQVRDQKVENLARIIRHFNLIPMHSSVSRKLVDEIIRPVAPYGLGGAYFHCFEAIMIPIGIQQSKQKGIQQLPIEFIFDEQEGEGEQAKQIYQVIRMLQPRSVRKVLSKEPVFRNDKEVVPLQAADMLAWHIRRAFEEGKTSPDVVPDFLMSREVSHMAADIDEAYLRRIADGISQIPHASSMARKNTWKKYRREMENLGLPIALHPRSLQRKQWIDRIRKFLPKFMRF
jgi:hypothetical protein